MIEVSIIREFRVPWGGGEILSEGRGEREGERADGYIWTFQLPRREREHFSLSRAIVKIGLFFLLKSDSFIVCVIHLCGHF